VTAQEGDDIREAGLMHRENVERAFDDDDIVTAAREDAVEIEEHRATADSLLHAVPRLTAIEAPADMPEEGPILVMDWKHDVMPENTRPGVVASPEEPRRGGVDAAIGEVIMRRVEWHKRMDDAQLGPRRSPRDDGRKFGRSDAGIPL